MAPALKSRIRDLIRENLLLKKHNRELINLTDHYAVRCGEYGLSNRAIKRIDRRRAEQQAIAERKALAEETGLDPYDEAQARSMTFKDYSRWRSLIVPTLDADAF